MHPRRPELFDPGSNASSPGQHLSPVAVDRFAPPPRRVSEVVLVGGERSSHFIRVS